MHKTFNTTAELAIPTGITTNEASAEIETHLQTAETRQENPANK